MSEVKERYKEKDCFGFVCQVNYVIGNPQPLYAFEANDSYYAFLFRLNELSAYRTIHVVAIFKVRLKNNKPPIYE